MKKNNTKSLLQSIATIFAIFLAVSSIYPPLRGLPGYTYLTLLAIGGWILCVGLSNPVFFTVFSKKPLYRQIVICFVTYVILSPFLFGNGVIGNRYLLSSQIILFYFIYQYNRYYGYEKSSRLIIMWTLPFVIITSITTVKNLAENPWLSRNIKSSGERTSQLLSQGIGGYEFIYFLVFICIILAFFLLNRKQLGLSYRLSVGVLVLLLLFVVTVAYANFFTALGMLVISTLILFITKKISIVTKFMVMIFGVLMLYQGKAIFLAVINWLIANLNGGYTVSRLITIQASVMGNGGGGGSLFSERLPVFEASIKAFLEAPIFGKIVTDDIYYSGGYLVGFGQHSQIIDTFALYGLFIGVIYLYIISQPFFTRFGKSRLNWSLNLAVFVSVLILFTMNNIAPSIGFAVFFIYPVIYDWVDDRLISQKTKKDSELAA